MSHFLIIVGQYEMNSAGTQACLVKSVTSPSTLSDACIAPGYPALTSPAGSNVSHSNGFGKLIVNYFTFCASLILSLKKNSLVIILGAYFKKYF